MIHYLLALTFDDIPQGRHNEILINWKNSLRLSVNQTMFCAKYLLKQIKKTVGFLILDRYDSVIVYFLFLILSQHNRFYHGESS